MFDLDQSIAQWRRQMAAEGVKSPELLDELESHLREDVKQQVNSGAHAPEAFATAVQRIGEASALKLEFETIGETPSARERKVTGILLVAALGLYAAFGLVFFFAAKAGLAERSTALAAVAFTVLSGLSGRLFLHRFLPAIARKRHRMIAQFALCILVGGWLVAFFHVVLPRFDFMPGQLVGIILWGMSPVGILNAVIYGLDEAVWRQGPAR